MAVYSWGWTRVRFALYLVLDAFSITAIHQLMKWCVKEPRMLVIPLSLFFKWVNLSAIWDNSVTWEIDVNEEPSFDCLTFLSYLNLECELKYTWQYNMDPTIFCFLCIVLAPFFFYFASPITHRYKFYHSLIFLIFP